MKSRREEGSSGGERGVARGGWRSGEVGKKGRSNGRELERWRGEGNSGGERGVAEGRVK